MYPFDQNFKPEIGILGIPKSDLIAKKIANSVQTTNKNLEKANKDQVEKEEAESSQANGTRILKRIEFEYGSQSFKFLINPEEFVQSEPSRATVTQTKGGAYLDAWGAGLTTIEIKGTTGFRSGTNNNDEGFKQFVALRSLIRTVYDTVVPGTKTETLLKFYNYTDDDYWYVYPLNFTLTRSKSKPLLYYYNITLQGLARIGECNPTDYLQPNSFAGEVNLQQPNQIVKDKIEPPAAEELTTDKKDEKEEGTDDTQSETEKSTAEKVAEVAKNTFSTCFEIGNWLSEHIIFNPAYNTNLIPDFNE